MKIIFLSHKFYPAIGGIETSSEMLASDFSTLGHEVHLLTWSKKENADNFPFKVIRSPGKIELLKEHAWADVVFENNPCLQLSWPAFFFNRPLVVALHTWLVGSNGKMGWQEKVKISWLRRAKKVIACSNALRNGTWHNAIVIGNAYKHQIFKRILTIPKTCDFVFLGRLVSDKGPDLAIKAIHKILSENLYKENCVLTIIGDGPELKSLKRQVSVYKLEKNVKFTGSMKGDELVHCLNQHKFLLVPSIWEEPFGIVVLEAMACGCIPIVSDCGGLPDAAGRAGLTFRRGDVDDLVASILKVIKNGTFQMQLLNAAESHLKAHYSDVISQKYLNVVKAAVKSK